MSTLGWTLRVATAVPSGVVTYICAFAATGYDVMEVLKIKNDVDVLLFFFIFFFILFSFFFSFVIMVSW